MVHLFGILMTTLVIGLGLEFINEWVKIKFIEWHPNCYQMINIQGPLAMFITFVLVVLPPPLMLYLGFTPAQITPNQHLQLLYLIAPFTLWSTFLCLHYDHENKIIAKLQYFVSTISIIVLFFLFLYWIIQTVLSRTINYDLTFSQHLAISGINYNINDGSYDKTAWQDISCILYSILCINIIFIVFAYASKMEKSTNELAFHLFNLLGIMHYKYVMALINDNPSEYFNNLLILQDEHKFQEYEYPENEYQDNDFNDRTKKILRRKKSSSNATTSSKSNIRNTNIDDYGAKGNTPEERSQKWPY